MPRKPPPLLHDVYDLTLALYKLVPTFPKAQRFVLGQRIEHTALEVLFGVEGANAAGARLASLARASRGLDELRLLLRLARDLGFVSIDRHESLSIQLDAAGRKLGGWLKWAQVEQASASG